MNPPLGQFSLVVIMSVKIIMYKNVPSVDDLNQESWRLLVEEYIANIKKLDGVGPVDNRPSTD